MKATAVSIGDRAIFKDDHARENISSVRFSVTTMFLGAVYLSAAMDPVFNISSFSNLIQTDTLKEYRHKIMSLMLAFSQKEGWSKKGPMYGWLKF